MHALQQIKFFVNSEERIVRVSSFPQDITLNQYLRDYANLTGTKRLCLEGGCGSCVVSVTKKQSSNNQNVTLSVNSCMVSLFSCNDWHIKTIEGIGNHLKGYHNIQKVLTNHHGTQCGYCTPGMIMNMYSLSKNNPNFTKENVEDSFSGNICRCTGYRPILQAFKSLCKNECDDNQLDIEDLRVCQKICKNNSVIYNFEYPKWYTPSNIYEIFHIFEKDLRMSYKLVGGNTANGVYKYNKNIDVYINISNVKELISYRVTENCLELGAGFTLTDCIKLLYKIGNKRNNYSYLINVADHINLIANVPIRNVGTIGGNLSIKHQHHEFPSDIFLLLETVGAKLIIADQIKEITVSLTEYLNNDMRHCLIKNIIFYPYDNNLYKFNSFKIMPRAQNAHALLQAGFLIKLDKNIVKNARIVYGCINKNFVHANATENFIFNKNIFNNDVLQEVYKTLTNELKPTTETLDTSPEFRIKLAISLFYKFILGIAPSVSDRNKSGALKLIRPISCGTQEYSTNKNLYPLTEPIIKIEALSQTSGEAQYISDMPDLPGQLYVAFVLTKAPPNSIIIDVNPSKALDTYGIVAYFDKNDIPGENNFMPESPFNVKEELFCSGVVQYYSQPVGIIVADSQELAERGSELVEIKYKYAEEKPLLTIRDVLKAQKYERLTEKFNFKAKAQGNNVKHVINGEFDIGYQYHFHMESQCCNVVPTDNGFDMYPSTQHMDNVQAAAAAVLNLPANKFNISVKRIGGAFGAKISRNAICSSAAVLACYKLRKPIKLWLPLNVNMKMIGKRFPFSANYEVGIDDDGKIQYLNILMYSNYGIGGNEDVLMFSFDPIQAVYDINTWNIKAYSVKTDTPAGTWCRAPGSLEFYAVIESMMDHIAHKINKDPFDVRLLNMSNENTKYLSGYINELNTWANINDRKIDIEMFNKANRWIKRGISVTPNIYALYPIANWPVIVTIYHIDGTVSISHGGIEIGQGINTKAMQVCAHALSIPIDKISIKPSNNLVAPNSMFTGASVTSEGVSLGIIKACEILMERMEPVKRKLGKTSWENLIKKSYEENVNLTAHFLPTSNCPEIKKYVVHLVCATEVEVDILTGNHLIKRVDILEDVGDSISPAIDVGQVEGGYVMGQGYWTMEEIKLSKYGEILTDNTWTYKVPGAKDVPIDFRVKFSNYNPNPVGILKAKAISEPPLTMTCSIPLAIRSAIASARGEINQEKWFKFDGPTNVENTFLNSLHDSKYYTI